MGRDYLQDYEEEYIPMEELGDNEFKSLPPRSAKHGINPKKKNGSIFHMLTGSLIFIIIISISVYFFMSLSDDKETENFDTIPNTTTNADSNGKNEQVNNSDSNFVEPNETENASGNSNTNEDVSENTNEDALQNTEEASLPVENNQEERIHIVKSGENLFRISILYYDSGEYYEELAQYNDLNSPTDIYAGMELKIPNKEALIANE